MIFDLLFQPGGCIVDALVRYLEIVNPGRTTPREIF